MKICILNKAHAAVACALFYFDYLTSVRNGSSFLGVSGKLRPKTRKAKTRTTKSNQCDFAKAKGHIAQLDHISFLLLYSTCKNCGRQNVSSWPSKFPKLTVHRLRRGTLKGSQVLNGVN